MPGYYFGPPGVGTATQAINRALFLQRSETFLAQGRSIAGDASRDPSNTNVGTLQAGLLMGKISTVINSLGTVGAYAPSIIGVANGAVAAGATSITVAAAVVTELLRRIGSSGTFKLTGPSVANGTPVTETVTYSAAAGTTITCTATVNGYVTGSFLCPTDGSETPLTMISDWDYGIQVTDIAGASIPLVDFAHVPVSGILDSTKILPAWPSDTGLQNWIISRLNDLAGGQFVFSNRY